MWYSKLHSEREIWNEENSKRKAGMQWAIFSMRHWKNIYSGYVWCESEVKQKPKLYSSLLLQGTEYLPREWKHSIERVSKWGKASYRKRRGQGRSQGTGWNINMGRKYNQTGDMSFPQNHQGHLTMCFPQGKQPLNGWKSTLYPVHKERKSETVSQALKSKSS